jgi:hypothetical protein
VHITLGFKSEVFAFISFYLSKEKRNERRRRNLIERRELFIQSIFNENFTEQLTNKNELKSNLCFDFQKIPQITFIDRFLRLEQRKISEVLMLLGEQSSFKSSVKNIQQTTEEFKKKVFH